MPLSKEHLNIKTLAPITREAPTRANNASIRSALRSSDRVNPTKNPSLQTLSTTKTWNSSRNCSFGTTCRRCRLKIKIRTNHIQEIQTKRIWHINQYPRILYCMLRVPANCRWSRLKERVVRCTWTCGHRNFHIMIYKNLVRKVQKLVRSVGHRSILKEITLLPKWRSQALQRRSRPRTPLKPICISWWKMKFKVRDWFL